MFLVSFSGAVLCAEETDLRAILPCHSPDAVHSGSVLFGSLSPLYMDCKLLEATCHQLL